MHCVPTLFVNILLCWLAAIQRTTAAHVTFSNQVRFLFDVDGNQIDAYGAKVNFFNGSYYLYGNSFSTTGVAHGIKSYSSPDLIHWQYNGFIFDPSVPNPCNNIGGCGRPHIVYNSKAGQYVLWANAGSSGYTVATSPSPMGPFDFLNSTASIDPRFAGLQPADFAVESFDDKAYIVYSVLDFTSPNAGNLWPPVFQTLRISELTPDFLNTTQRSFPVTSPTVDLIDQEAESPDLLIGDDGAFYVSASNTCGYCNGSLGLLYRTRQIEGPWERQILSGYSCNGQVEGVLSLPQPHGATTYLWHSTSVPGGPRVGFSGHIFQPLHFDEDGSAKHLDCSASVTFEVTFERGVGNAPSGQMSKAVDGSPAIGDYTAICDTDQFTLYQTWQASKSGRIQSVSVNVARSVQTVPLTMTLFKFDSYADLVKPEYKWTEIGAATYNASDLTYVFDAASVNAINNTAISEGDLLGFSISGSDFAPYCYLTYTIPNKPSTRLFQQGVGQNSWRGLKGKTSPVYERVGESMKFFVTYE